MLRVSSSKDQLKLVQKNFAYGTMQQGLPAKSMLQ